MVDCNGLVHVERKRGQIARLCGDKEPAGREAGELLLALGQLAQQQNYAAARGTCNPDNRWSGHNKANKVGNFSSLHPIRCGFI